MSEKSAISCRTTNVNFSSWDQNWNELVIIGKRKVMNSVEKNNGTFFLVWFGLVWFASMID
jgi:hypothetical protein